MQTLNELAERYNELDPTAMMACIAVLRTGSDMMAMLEKMLNPHGLSQGGYLTLIVLNRDPQEEISPSDLAARVGVTRATMTGLLDTLAKEGLVERIPHDNDRRRMVVRLTRKGTVRLGHLLPELYSKITELMAGISEKERKVLIQLMGKVNTGLDRMGG